PRGQRRPGADDGLPARRSPLARAGRARGRRARPGLDLREPDAVRAERGPGALPARRSARPGAARTGRRGRDFRAGRRGDVPRGLQHLRDGRGTDGASRGREPADALPRRHDGRREVAEHRAARARVLRAEGRATARGGAADDARPRPAGGDRRDADRARGRRAGDEQPQRLPVAGGAAGGAGAVARAATGVGALCGGRAGRRGAARADAGAHRRGAARAGRLREHRGSGDARGARPRRPAGAGVAGGALRHDAPHRQHAAGAAGLTYASRCVSMRGEGAMPAEPLISDDELVAGVRAVHGDPALPARVRKRRRLRPTQGLTGSYFERVQIEVGGERHDAILKQAGLDGVGPAMREGAFFREVAPRVPVRVPRVWGVGPPRADGGDAWVLMEALPRGKRIIEWSAEDTDECVRNLARLHAAYLHDPPAGLPRPFTDDLERTLAWVPAGADALRRTYAEWEFFPRVISERSL